MIQVIAIKAFGKKVLGWLALVPIWAWLALAILIAFWLHGSARYAAGVATATATCEAEKAEHQAEVAALNEKLKAIKPEVQYVVQTKLVEVAAKAKIIRERIPYYVPADTPDLPPGFRLLHDAAAQQVDAPSTAAIAAAAPVEAQVASATVFDNYAAHHRNEAVIEGWQLWWRRIEEACAKSKACGVEP